MASSGGAISRQFSRSLSVGGTSRVFEDDTESTNQTFLLRMEELWREQQFCDITFLVEREQIAAHRVVLAARSHYFEALFQPYMREGHQSTIELKELMANYFRLLLSYMYSGHITITDENIEGVLWTGNYLGLESVCEACGKFLLDSLTVDDAFSVLELANAYDQVQLQASVKEYILKHFGPISNRPKFLECPPTELEQFLKNEDALCVRRDDGSCLPIHDVEFTLAQRLVNYVRHDRTRFPFLPRALGHVRLGLMTQDQIDTLKGLIAGIGAAGECEDVLNNFSKEVVPRRSSVYKVVSGPCYSHGDQVGGYISDHILNDDGTSPVCGLYISVRRWDGRSHLGGLKLFFLDGHEEEIGDLNGPDHYQVRLEPGERIIGAQVNSGWLIDQLTFKTDAGRVLGPYVYGGNGGGERPEESPIKARGYGYLVGISCSLVYRQSRHSLTRLSFRWLVYE